MLFEEMEEDLDERIGNLNARAAQFSEQSGATAESWRQLESKLNAMLTKADRYAASLESLDQRGTAEVAQLVGAMAGAPEVESLLKLVSGIEQRIGQLGISREGQEFAINNPRIGGVDVATCPPGTFVYQVHASGAVGGKYGIDGISQLKVRCAKVMPDRE